MRVDRAHIDRVRSFWRRAVYLETVFRGPSKLGDVLGLQKRTLWSLRQTALINREGAQQLQPPPMLRQNTAPPPWWTCALKAPSLLEGWPLPSMRLS